MTLTGSGVGGNIGGPAIPLQKDIEATAWTEVNKAALGIVPDSIEKSLVELTPRYATGAAFCYKSVSCNPLLDHPLENFALSRSVSQNNLMQWMSEYENLLNDLPPDLLEKMMQEKDKPLAERNSYFYIFNTFLESLAKFLNRSDQLSVATEISTLEANRTLANTLLPFSMLKGALQNGKQILSQAEATLTHLGANYPFFDQLTPVTKELKQALQLFGLLDSSFAETNGGQLTEETKATAAQVAERLGVLRSQLERVSFGNNLQILLFTIKSLELIATSLSFENTQSAPLFIALSLASIGIFNTENGTGVFGPYFQVISENILKTVFSDNYRIDNPAGEKLVSLAFPLSAAFMVGLAYLSKDYFQTDLLNLPNKKTAQILSAQFFGFEVAFSFLSQTKIVSAFYEGILEAAGVVDNTQIAGSRSISQMMHLFMLMTVAHLFNQPAEKLVVNQETILLKELSELEKLAETHQQTDLSFHFNLSLAALKAYEYQEFSESLNLIFTSLGAPEDDLKKDISQIGTLVKTMAEIITSGNQSNNEEIRTILSVI